MTTTREAEDDICDLLERVTGQFPVGFHREDSQRASVSVYLRQPWTMTPARRRRWNTGLQRLREDGIPVGPVRWSQKEIPYEDWANAWKRHIRALDISPALLIKPTWSTRQRRPGQAVVVVDPGLSFGTGDHPTTGFCLRQLVANRQPGKPQSLLDLGTGSGILAIAAVKLGYAPVVATDYDPKAVEIALENARRNGVAEALDIRQEDLNRPSRIGRQKFEIVCANLERDLLLSASKRIIAHLRPGGTLLLAGILREQFREIQEHYQCLGLRLSREETKKEWRSGAFVLGARPENS